MAEVSAETMQFFGDVESIGNVQSMTAGSKFGEYESASERAVKFATMGAPAAAVGFADTVLQSVGLTDDGDVEEFVRATLPPLGQYYSESKEAAQTIGDFVGMFLPGLGAAKLVSGGGRLAKFVAGNTRNRYLNSIFTSGKTYDQLLRKVKLRDAYLGRQGNIADPNDFVRMGRNVRDERATAATITALSDRVKETVAFEAGVWATMSDSQTLYPDEMTTSELLLLNAAAPAVFAGAEQLFMRRILRQSAQEAVRVATDVRNPLDVPYEDLITRPGMRDTGVTFYAGQTKALHKAMQDATSQVARQNFNNEALTTATRTKELVEKLGQDSILRDVTKREALSPAQVKSALNSLEIDSTSLMNTVSLQKAPSSPSEFADFTASVKAKSDKLGDEITELRAKMQSDFDKADEYAQQISGKQKEKDLIDGLEYFVVEADGAISLAATRKPLFQDGERHISVQPRTQIEPKMFKVEAQSDPIYATKSMVVGFTEDGHLLVPEAPQAKTMVAGINATRVVDPANIRLGEDYKLLLKDMGEDWHFKTGKRGKDIYGQLPSDLRHEIDRWTGSSSASKIREWVDAGDPKARMIFDAYQPMRDRLRELAGPDGTIPLLRGESKLETSKPSNDVVSMTSNPKVAQSFANKGGGNVISRRVPVDDIIMIVGGLGQEYEFIVKGNTKRNVGEVVDTASFEVLSLYQRSAGYAAMQKAVDSFDASKIDRIVLSPGDHHTRIDYALELIAKHGDAALSKIQLPPSIKTVRNLEYASIARKYDEYIRLRQTMDASLSAKIKLTDPQKLTMADIPRMLNLPTMQDGGLHPLIEIMEGAYQQGTKRFADAMPSLDAVEDTIAKMIDPRLIGKQVFGEQGGQLTTRGNMLAIPEDAKPVMAIKRPFGNEPITRELLERRVAQTQEEALNTMRRAEGTIVSELTNFMDSVAATQVAKQVSGLGEGTQRGSGAILQQPFSAGETPALQAAYQLADVTDRQFRTYTGKLLENVLPQINQLKAPMAAPSLRKFNEFVHARRQAWDLADAPVQGSAGVSFKLRDTEANKQRWKEMFGYDMPEGAVMPQPAKRINGYMRYTPLELDEKAFAAVQAINQLDSIVLNETNVLKKAAGFGTIKRKEWHVPPKNFSRGEIRHIITADGRYLRSLSARTEAAADRLAEETIAAMGQPGLLAVTPRKMEEYFNLNDEAFSKMVAFDDPVAQTGRARGTSADELLIDGPDGINDILSSINRQFESVLRRTRMLYFEPQMNYARQLLDSSGAANRAAGQTVWQKYMAAMLGNPTLNRNEPIGRAYSTVESIYDEVLNRGWDRLQEAIGRRPAKAMQGTQLDPSIKKQLDKNGPDFAPLPSLVDYAAKTYQASPPPNMKKHMAALSNITSLLALRLAEIGHPILNMTSLAATTPAVIKALARNSIETTEQYAARIAAYGVPLGEGAGMFSATRALISATHFMFTKEGNKVWKEAAEAGYFDQAVSEAMRTLTAPTESWLSGMIRSKTAWLTKLSDRSEELARAMSFMTGYHIAQRGLGIKDKNNAFLFAHKFANDVIGDYNPNNRPRIFQGAVGMPLGLFQTFMWNYNQRLFSYIENKQHRALMTQYATQAFIFGAQGVPGFQQFNEFFASNYDGTVNPVDALQNRFGSDVTDWFLYGTISNLPKLFGADDGIALYTRGDANVRLPVFDGLPPSVQMVSNAFGALRDTVSALRTGNATPQQISEITAQYSLSRPLRNIIEIANGYSVDARGQLISNDVRDGLSIAARIAGMRPMQEAKRNEAYYRIRSTELSQMAKMQDLRSQTRALMRDGFQDADVASMLQRYMRNGGRPERFPRWLAEQSIVATQERDMRELMEAVKNPNRVGDILRLMNAGVLSSNDPDLQEVDSVQ